MYDPIYPDASTFEASVSLSGQAILPSVITGLWSSAYSSIELDMTGVTLARGIADLGACVISAALGPISPVAPRRLILSSSGTAVDNISVVGEVASIPVIGFGIPGATEKLEVWVQEGEQKNFLGSAIVQYSSRSVRGPIEIGSSSSQSSASSESSSSESSASSVSSRSSLSSSSQSSLSSSSESSASSASSGYDLGVVWYSEPEGDVGIGAVYFVSGSLNGHRTYTSGVYSIWWSTTGTAGWVISETAGSLTPRAWVGSTSVLGVYSDGPSQVEVYVPGL